MVRQLRKFRHFENDLNIYCRTFDGFVLKQFNVFLENYWLNSQNTCVCKQFNAKNSSFDIDGFKSSKYYRKKVGWLSSLITSNNSNEKKSSKRISKTCCISNGFLDRLWNNFWFEAGQQIHCTALHISTKLSYFCADCSWASWESKDLLILVEKWNVLRGICCQASKFRSV